ncbi:hypothetical protein WOC76_21585 [Methylocystis sp. IM3]|uniref:hypothetical protein n=1 Tax=unclassified Methylocystis TaxID=2625913 RepID=UPI0030F7694F
MSIFAKENENEVVLSSKKDRVHVHNSGEPTEHISALLETRPRDIIIDLHQLDFTDSPRFGNPLAGHKNVIRPFFDFVLKDLEAGVKSVLELTWLDRALDINPDPSRLSSERA